MIDFENLRFDPDHHLGLGDIRLTIAQQQEIEAENKRLRSALAMIREITGQDSVFHEADNALAGQGGEG